MCYKRQKQGGFFLNLTPKQSHDFLVECLDMNHLHDKILKLEEKLKNQYKPRKISLQGSIEAHLKSLDQFTNLLNEKQRPEPPVLEGVDGKRLHIDFLTTELEDLRDKKAKKLIELGPAPQKPLSFVFEEEEQLISLKDQISNVKKIVDYNIQQKELGVQQANSAIYKIESKLSETKFALSTVNDRTRHLSQLNAELQHILEQKCPTCLKKWDSEGFDQKKQKLESDILETKETINTAQQELNKIPTYELMLAKAQEVLKSKQSSIINVKENEEINALQEQLRVLVNKKENLESSINQAYLEKHNEWNMFYQAIVSDFDSKIRNIEQEIVQTNNKIQQIELQQKAYEQAIATYESDIQNIKNKKENISSELIKQQNDLNQIEKDILLSEESIRLIKNFTLQKFQDTLDYIGHKATEIINNIPNMSNAVIYFDNSKETKSGNIKNEVNAIINLEGDSDVPIKTLSGGERTSADFAIDLAVSEMIESMTQKGVNFLIIDEGFDGLDSISKIQCLEILKSLDTDKKIIIVDHSSEVKEMVSDIIKVKRIKEESIIDA